MAHGSIQIIQENLSELIYHTLNNLSTEQRHPGMDADEMDQNLSDLKEKYQELKRIRDEFEIICSGVVGFGPKYKIDANDLMKIK